LSWIEGEPVEAVAEADIDAAANFLGLIHHAARRRSGAVAQRPACPAPRSSPSSDAGLSGSAVWRQRTRHSASSSTAQPDGSSRPSSQQSSPDTRRWDCHSSFPSLASRAACAHRILVFTMPCGTQPV
jgi:hypothetical protein